MAQEDEPSSFRIPGRALVIGAANLDVLGFAGRSLEPGDSIPGEIHSCPGGVARNVAENLGRIGVDVELLAAVGSDPSGTWLIEETRAAGVGCDHVLRLAGERTATYLALHDQAGELQLAIADVRVAEALSIECLKRFHDLIERADALVVDANVPAVTTDFLLERYAAKPVFLDPASRAKAERVQHLVPRVHTLKVNRAEAGFLVGTEVRDVESATRAVERLLDLGVTRAFVTLGEEGMCYGSAEERGHVAACSTEVVSVTGAGDACLAGLVAGHLGGRTARETAQMAARLASRALQSPFAVNPEIGPSDL